MPKTVISCLLDNHPQFLMQCWNWLASLHVVGAQDRAEIIIHHTPEVPQEDLTFFAGLGARLEMVQPFGPGNARYCNKIRQLESKAVKAADYAIFCDTDLLFVECPTRYAVGSAVRAKIVDLPNPPIDLCRALLERAGLKLGFELVPTDFEHHELTLPTNFNGGIYVLPRVAIEVMRNAWPKWAKFCLEQGDLLESWGHHADQLGFALAMLESRLLVAPLRRGANFPTHLPQPYYSSIEPERISAFHYHDRLDASGFLEPTNIPWIDAQIASGNEAIGPFRRRTFSNGIFWDFRYATHSELGSGVGSRGAVLNYKRRLISPFLKAFADDEILDIGCGDIEATRYAPVRHYTGIDRSGEAIAIAKSKRPDWTFRAADINEIECDAADLVLCLDLLIHEREPHRFREMIDKLVCSARKALIVSGYEVAPESQGIVFFHEPLSEMLKRRDGVADVKQIGRYRDVLVLLVKKKGTPLLVPNGAELGELAVDDTSSGVATFADETGTIAELRQQLNAVYSSWSWRVTKPLRVIGALAKRVKR